MLIAAICLILPEDTLRRLFERPVNTKIDVQMYGAEITAEGKILKDVTITLSGNYSSCSAHTDSAPDDHLQLDIQIRDTATNALYKEIPVDRSVFSEITHNDLYYRINSYC